MGSKEVSHPKPHAVFVPYPAQGHIKPMLQLAKLFNHKGFHITFVNTEFNHNRFLKSLGPNSLNGFPDFNFETIPDGLPPSDSESTQDIPSLFNSIRKNLSLPPFLELLAKLNSSASSCSSSSNNNNNNNNDIPPVTCIVSDRLMLFTIRAAEELGIPIVLFITIAASVFMAHSQLPALVEKGLAPLKDEVFLTNGFLDKVIDWIPGIKDIRLRDIPTFSRIRKPDDIVFNFLLEAVQALPKASAFVIHSFYELEPEVIDALSSATANPNIFAVGPLQLLLNHIQQDSSSSSSSSKQIGYSLWKEETECLKWLDSKPQNSVLYVNFGSITVLTPQQLLEFGWGLANSKQTFLWVVRPDLVIGDQAVLPPEFADQIKEMGFIASWCPQDQVLNHPSIGGFLTHCGWNSTIESLSAGVPMLCWPFFADQPTNCRLICKEWGVGMEIDNDVKRDGVEKLVRELMEGERGKEMKRKALEWKKLAQEACGQNGSSALNLDSLVKHVCS
ncbi:7-deoxyloganetin glucosyltransferase-like [Ziziphus jujuba]|uniref:Glycosyltransferase n=1 Tax=Ziziphus jujuba TaxID=326968 RepID=A0A6P3ZP38_ZIZJJ|nr:7-deoxyloganetin glucosyltransferase-like [Ziziphus jujuba]XP_048327098.2 7-deoxyloganetin glucosyltransferase-like [Ziziphus jujuba]